MRVIQIKDNVVIVKDKEEIKTMVSEIKRNILGLLSEENLTCEEIADILGKHRSNIYRHLTELQEYDFVEVKKEEKVDRSKRKVYGKTADLFVPLLDSLEAPHSSDVSIRWDEKSTDKVLKILSNMGFEPNEDLNEELIEFFEEMNILSSELFKNNEEFNDLDLFSVMKLKLLILFAEIQNDTEVKKRFKAICNKFVD
ncbi:MAG: helix-turn-helix domain-containing protein [Thermoplasmatota archaeon]